MHFQHVFFDYILQFTEHETDKEFSESWGVPFHYEICTVVQIESNGLMKNVLFLELFDGFYMQVLYYLLEQQKKQKRYLVF